MLLEINNFRHFPAIAQITDYQELLDNPEINTVFIATPDNTHVEIILVAVKANKHILCKKTLEFSDKKVALIEEVLESMIKP